MEGEGLGDLVTCGDMGGGALYLFSIKLSLLHERRTVLMLPC